MRRIRSPAVRCHSDPTRVMLTPPALGGDNYISVTPQVVGKVWSREDDFYTPAVSGFNPFIAHRFRDGSKIVHRDNFMAAIDLPSPIYPLTPPCTPMSSEDAAHFCRNQSPSRSQSLPGSPLSRRRVHQVQYEVMSPFYIQNHSHSRTPTPVLNKYTMLGLECEFDDDNKSDVSSCDSAVELNPRDRYASRFNSRRKFSMEPPMVEAWQSSVPTRTELIARCLDAHDSDWMPTSPVSDQWSESCMSLDDSLMSPCSSLSSYSETDYDQFPVGLSTLHPLSHAAATHAQTPRTHLEQLEARVRSRERFQALVTRWEQKQQRQHQQDQLASDSPISEYVYLPRYIPCLNEQKDDSDAPLEKRFHELRSKWEQKQVLNRAHNELKPNTKSIQQ